MLVLALASKRPHLKDSLYTCYREIQETKQTETAQPQQQQPAESGKKRQRKMTEKNLLCKQWALLILVAKLVSQIM